MVRVKVEVALGVKSFSCLWSKQKRCFWVGGDKLLCNYRRSIRTSIGRKVHSSKLLGRAIDYWLKLDNLDEHEGVGF